ncbi:MAG: class I SAM-dependent methyltransferase [Sulfolobales archaeon]
MSIVWQTHIPRGLYAKLYTPWRRVNFEVNLLAKIFNKYGARKIVEFGCGIGRHGYALWKKGFDVLLTDVFDWRYGVARKLPFKEYDLLRGGHIGVFDAGYSMNVIILFDPVKIIKVLNNVKENIKRGGIFVFDYNYKLYEEPTDFLIKHGRRVYRVILRKNIYEKKNDHVVYSYRTEIFNGDSRLVGFEEASYPIYSREDIEKSIVKAGYRIIETIDLVWDPIKYMYRENISGELDSVLYITSPE